jgi:hypothetical protein
MSEKDKYLDRICSLGKVAAEVSKGQPPRGRTLYLKKLRRYNILGISTRLRNMKGGIMGGML